MLKQVEKKDKEGNTIICTVDENGVEQGPYEIHFKDGVIGKGTYKDGKADGPYESHYENGQLWEKGNFRNGNAEGEWVAYYPNGQLEDKGCYQNDFAAGLWEYYYENGQLKEKGNYIKGDRGGEWIFYYDNGKIKAKGNYVNGNVDGIWEEYDEKGEVQGVLYREGIGTFIKPEVLDAYKKGMNVQQEKIDAAEKAHKSEKEVIEKRHKVEVATAGLKGKLEMLSDPEFWKPIGKARTPERQAKAEEIVEVRRARTLLSRAAQKAFTEGDKELLSEIENVARPYALHNRRIQLEFRNKRMERRAKKDRG